MITIDARTLREPNPTGVTEVARQCIAHIIQAYPDSRLFTGDTVRSDTISNVSLLLRLTTIERQACVFNEPSVVFLPNTHFIHTERGNVQVRVVHDLSFAHAPQWYAPRVRLWHRAAHAVSGLHEADFLIAVSEWTKRDLVEFLHIPEERVQVVHPATPRPQGGARPTNLPLKNEPYFLFLGTLEKRKNVRGVVEAFEKIKMLPALRDHHLVLAGRIGFGGPSAHALPERVHQLPYTSIPEKWWLLKHAAALVYPSFSEGFGLPPLEAAAVGCPTIISDCTAVRETMGDASLQVSPYDISQIAMAMEAIVCERQLTSVLKIRGFERAAWYSAERQRSALLTVLERAHAAL
ncbi:MAG: hypothetical protein A2848_00935 [Candidatus Magasanikbacteria bacterium RIFCSPHIGHO2_01_FULL_50_8]|uniref:Glycosyl transferase family 1 domain-containing protein n=2 Tax=Candidatus Magasanikiibacteriota TaxID=1752731 RepID=A0A1F6LUC5_9BACT|nr:MAG: hypothetical protein A2848_00935 [Candidatus Magasanikbacteria bacterium RIFCSPHIGHO2_01_FULL_50_8]OGH68189.1 MAG: hypothetical protein A3C15_01040 [Candidatus Magasanikbacteria bacterium RIFCSPHIGHO2_02_FULL_50_9b]